MRSTFAMETLLQDESLLAQFVNGPRGRLVVSFAGVGTNPHETPAPEFFRLSGAGSQNAVLFVADKSRCWLNTPGMAEQLQTLIAQVAARVGADEIILMGNSMGATMALLLADRVGASKVVALVPQVSADPAVVPEEPRWMRFRQRITQWCARQVTDWPQYAQVFVLHGDSADELVHALRFPLAQDNVLHVILRGAGHGLARDLHNRGVLARLVGDMMSGRKRRVRVTLRALGGVLRADFSREVPA